MKNTDHPLVIMSKAFPPSILAAMMVQIFLLVGGIIIGSVLLGLFLDSQFGTRPALTLVLGIVSLPVAVFLTYALAMRTAKKSRAAYLDWADKNKGERAIGAQKENTPEAARSA